MSSDFARSTCDHDRVIAAIRQWLEIAVIGLNLCPFAKSVYLHQRIRYVVSDAASIPDLREDLRRELRFLSECNPDQVDTTLLILPAVLADFFAFNDFLRSADRMVAKLDLEGTLQIASFHPRYQFTESESDDIDNFTNRSPYPILHLLRESSIDHAVAAFPDADAIVGRNIATLRQLGHAGWDALRLPVATAPAAVEDQTRRPSR